MYSYQEENTLEVEDIWDESDASDGVIAKRPRKTRRISSASECESTTHKILSLPSNSSDERCHESSEDEPQEFYRNSRTKRRHIPDSLIDSDDGEAYLCDSEKSESESERSYSEGSNDSFVVSGGEEELLQLQMEQRQMGKKTIKKVKKRKAPEATTENFLYPEGYVELAQDFNPPAHKFNPGVVDNDTDEESEASQSSSVSSAENESIAHDQVARPENERKLNTFYRPDSIKSDPQNKEYESQKIRTINLFKKLVEEKNNRRQTSLPTQPEEIIIELFPHQMRGLQFMIWRETLTHPGGLIADEMGESILAYQKI